MINKNSTLSTYLQELSPEFCGMDLEADSLHRYEDSLCLIQFTDGSNHKLLDPLALEDLSPLEQLLNKSNVWMHGADYDMTLMLKTWGSIPQFIFDTQIAARLVGAQRFGYANLVEDFLGVELDKGSQKADWSIRPLTEKMTEYALNDVVYLQPLAEVLVKKLHELERYDWFIESCEDAMQRTLNRNPEKEDPWKIKGSGRLNPEGLAYLKELWHWREDEAREWDRPVFMVCGNKSLIEWVTDLTEKKVPQLPKHFRSSRVNKFIAATNKVKKMQPADYPKKVKPLRMKKDPEFEARVDLIIKGKNKLAEEYNIDSSLLSNRATVEAIVRKDVKPEDSLMKWQYALLKEVIQHGLETPVAV